MAFQDFDIEIQNIKDSDPEHFNGQVSNAGTPVNISPTSGKLITAAYIQNPSRGPRGNGGNDLLFINIDGGSTFITLTRGESLSLPGVFDTLSIDTNNNGTWYEVIVWS